MAYEDVIYANYPFEAFTSSNILSFRYSYDASVLIVEFKNGTGYAYYDVPAETVEQFCASPSKGRFLHYEIKGKYTYSKL